MSLPEDIHTPLIIGDGADGANGAYSPSTLSLNVSEIDKDRLWYVPERIANVTSLAIGAPSARYPSDNGFSMVGFPRGLSLTGKLTGGAGVTVTAMVEATNNLEYWVDVTKLFTKGDGTAPASLTVTAGILTFAIAITQLPRFLYYRVPITIVGGIDNAVIMDLLRFP
jgi:hypothetical protein